MKMLQRYTADMAGLVIAATWWGTGSEVRAQEGVKAVGTAADTLPRIDCGHTTWVLPSSALVLFMMAPSPALFCCSAFNS